MRLDRRRYLALGASALAGVALAPRAARAADTIRVGMMRLPNALFAGMDQGFFSAEGIDVYPVFFAGLAELEPALAGGTIDVAMVSPDAAMFNAFALGANATFVADYWTAVRNSPSGDAAFIVVRKELAPFGAFRPKESGAITAAVVGRGHMTALFGSAYLASVKISKGDVNVVEMPFTDMAAALQNDAVDVAVAVDPYATLMVERNIGVKLTGLSGLMPGYVLGVMIYGQRLGKADRGLGQRFMRAFAKSNTYLRAQLATPAGRGIIAQIYQKDVPIESPDLYRKIGLAVGTEKLTVQAEGRYGLIWQMDQYANAGLVLTRPNVSAAVDNSFAEAVARSK